MLNSSLSVFGHQKNPSNHRLAEIDQMTGGDGPKNNRIRSSNNIRSMNSMKKMLKYQNQGSSESPEQMEDAKKRPLTGSLNVPDL